MINIGAIIYGKLMTVASTYPLVAENGSAFPFIVYKTEQQRPVENKDMIYEWEYNIEVNIVDDHYDKVVELCSQAVDKLLELETSFSINILSISEDFAEDAYIKSITIQIYI